MRDLTLFDTISRGGNWRNFLALVSRREGDVALAASREALASRWLSSRTATRSWELRLECRIRRR
jgi:hypothetical protein